MAGDMTWATELSLARRVSVAAGRDLAQIGLANRVALSAKGRDIKLQADVDTERLILDLLRNEGSYSVLAEETGVHGGLGPEPFWVVDPLDGSMNFSRDIPLCCVSIALVSGLDPVLGVIYDFVRNELFYGVAGEGAWLVDSSGTESRLAVSDVKRPGDAILATGLPLHVDVTPGAMDALAERMRSFKKIRMLGSAALSLAYVASGRIDAYAEGGIMFWDVAAGIALVRAAGGIASWNPTGVSQWTMDVRAASSDAVWST